MLKDAWPSDKRWHLGIAADGLNRFAAGCSGGNK